MVAQQINRWRCAAAAALAGCVLVAGCSAARPAAASASPPGSPGTLVLGGLRPVSGPAARTYLGAVTGTDALIGVVVQGTRARAYLCDGAPGRAVTLADWFTGPVHGGTLDAVSGQHRVHFTVRLGQRTATGTVTLADGRVFGFTAAMAAGSPPAGVFEGTGLLHGLSYHAGQIVLPDGDQRAAAAFPTGPVKGRAISYLPLAPV
jgi:hypothetical protein